MKKYDLKKIMQMARRTYKSKTQRYGRTFGECLKDAWAIAKSEVKFREEREARMRAMMAEQQPMATVKHDERNLKWDDFYNVNSRGYMGAQYCGD